MYLSVSHTCVLCLIATRCCVSGVCSPFSEILPTLIVCHNLTQAASPVVKTYFQSAILPDAAQNDAALAADNQETAFFFRHLTFFLTCLDTNVKRYVGEWLFLLCDENGTASFNAIVLHECTDVLIDGHLFSHALMCGGSGRVHTTHGTRQRHRDVEDQRFRVSKAQKTELLDPAAHRWETSWICCTTLFVLGEWWL